MNAITNLEGEDTTYEGSGSLQIQQYMTDDKSGLAQPMAPHSGPLSSAMVSSSDPNGNGEEAAGNGSRGSQSVSNSSSPALTNREHAQYDIAMQRESRWAEIRKTLELMRRFTMNGEISEDELSKDDYFELYSNGVNLLKSLDALDPDRVHGRRPEMYGIPPLMTPFVPRPYDFYSYRGYYPYYGEVPAMVYGNDQVTKKRHRRQPSPGKRNIACGMCGVTKTPEWRRGPAGEHTLCNACGLQYAKTIKKQKKEKDRKEQDLQMNAPSTIEGIANPQLGQNMNMGLPNVNSLTGLGQD